MPVDHLQQLVARSIVASRGFGSELWAAAGIALTLLLVALALLVFLSPSKSSRWRASRWGALILSDGFFLSAAIAALVLLRIPTWSQLALNPDEEGLILGARTLLRDPRFWISFENTTLGPLSTFALVPVGLLGLPIGYTAARIVGMLVWAAVIVLLFLGLRRLYTPVLARILVLPVLITIIGFSYWDYVAFNGEHMAVLLLSVAFFLQAPLLRDPTTPLPARSLLFGATLALVPLAKIQPGPLALAWGVIGLAHAFIYCRRRVGYIAAGAAIPILVLGVYLVTSGAAYDFWQSYVLNNLLYAAVGWNATQQDVTFVENALRAPIYFLEVPDSRGLVLFTGILLVIVAALAWRSERFRRRILACDVVQGVLLVLAASVCVLMPKNNWTHYLLLLAVPTAMMNAALLAGLLEEARERAMSIRITLSEPGASWGIRGTVLIAASIAFLGGIGPAVMMLKDGHPAMSEAADNLFEGRNADPVTAAVLQYVDPGDPVAHWGVFFQPLARAGVSLGTRDVHIERALYPSRQQEYYLDRFVTDVLERRPRLLIDTNNRPEFKQFRLENFPAQRSALTRHYEIVEEVDGNHIYILRTRSVGPP